MTLTESDTEDVDALTSIMCGLIDLELTLRHATWNIKDPTFEVSLAFNLYARELAELADQIATRINNLGGDPVSTADEVVLHRPFNEYGIDRATLSAHAAALCVYLDHVQEQFEENRKNIVSADTRSDALAERALMLTASIQNWLDSFLNPAAAS